MNPSPAPASAAVDALLRQRLTAAAERLQVGLAPEQTERLLAYLRSLQRWNAVYNLTSVRDPAQMLTLHLIDCLALIGPLRRELSPAEDHRLLDVGSGAGLPGIVIALLNPALAVTCVDAVGKKAAFIQQVAAELHLPNLHAVHARVERMSGAPYDLITSRAFASLADFVALTRPQLARGGRWLAMKGKTPTDEIAALPADVEVFHVEPLAVPELDAERCLVWMRIKP